MTNDNKLDAIINELKAEHISPSAELLRRVAEVPLRHQRPAVSAWSWLIHPQRWTLVAAGVIALSLGGLSGWTLELETEEAELWAAADEEGEWEQLSTLALATELDGDWE